MTFVCPRAPFVVGQLLLQQEDFGLELVPLVEDVPQLLQGKPGPVGILGVQSSHLVVAQRLLARDKNLLYGEEAEDGEKGGRREEGRKVRRKSGYLCKILEHGRHVLIAHRLLVVNGEL